MEYIAEMGIAGLSAFGIWLLRTMRDMDKRLTVTETTLDFKTKFAKSLEDDIKEARKEIADLKKRY